MGRRGLGGAGRNVFLVPSGQEAAGAPLPPAVGDDNPLADRDRLRYYVERATSAECGVPTANRPPIGTSQALHRPLSHEVFERGPRTLFGVVRDVAVHDLIGMTAHALAGGQAAADPKNHRGRLP